MEKNIYDRQKKIVSGFKNGILLLSKKDDMKNHSGDEEPDILDTTEQTKFNDFFQQVREHEKDRDMNFSEEQVVYKIPSKMLQTLHNLKNRVNNSNANEVNLIECNFEYFENRVKKMSEGVNKNKGKKILRIVNKILDLNFNEQKLKGQWLKILTPNQMLSRLPISLAQ